MLSLKSKSCSAVNDHVLATNRDSVSHQSDGVTSGSSSGTFPIHVSDNIEQSLLAFSVLSKCKCMVLTHLHLRHEVQRNVPTSRVSNYTLPEGEPPRTSKFRPSISPPRDRASWSRSGLCGDEEVVSRWSGPNTSATRGAY